MLKQEKATEELLNEIKQTNEIKNFLEKMTKSLLMNRFVKF